MDVIITIPTDRIVQLFSSAIEGGDPVTTAAKGGWCAGIYYRSKASKPPRGYWYDMKHAAWFEDRTKFQVQVDEVVDEEKGTLKSHLISATDVERGLSRMADVFPSQFAQILSDEVDAPAADAFLQATLFGKEKYA